MLFLFAPSDPWRRASVLLPSTNNDWLPLARDWSKPSLAPRLQKKGTRILNSLYGRT